HDRGIVAHVVDHTDEAMIEHRQRLEQDLLERRCDRPQRLGCTTPGLGDLGLLVGGEGHRCCPSLAADSMGRRFPLPWGKSCALRSRSKSLRERLYWSCRATDYGDKRRVT